MEVVYTDYLNRDEFKKRSINGLYGDVLDLLDMRIDVKGIFYNDNWKVSRFLSSICRHSNKRVESILKYLEVDKQVLKNKISNLNTFDFKMILLAYLLINNKDILIFDYFEVGLNYKEQKRFINILRKLKEAGKTIIIISNNFIFMNRIIDNILVFNKNKIVYNGNINNLITIDDDFITNIPIIKFITLANKKGANLDYTLDDKELLKDIYRGSY